MIRSEIAQLRRRTVLASYNKSINGGGNIARSFQTHPHVIFSMLTCTRENVCLTIIDGTPNIWVPMESL